MFFSFPCQNIFIGLKKNFFSLSSPSRKGCTCLCVLNCHGNLDLQIFFILFQTQCMYVWIDGTGEYLRAKTRTVNFVPKEPKGKFIENKRKNNVKWFYKVRGQRIG